MELILWRHAEAADGVPDEERALTAKGHRQAKRVAKWLARRLPEGTRVIASPARRAQQTARALADEVQTLAAAAVGEDAETLLQAIGWPHRGAGAVVVVGHQPTLGEAVALALTGTRAPIRLKKGACVWLAWRRRAGRGEVTLRAAASPGLL